MWDRNFTFFARAKIPKWRISPQSGLSRPLGVFTPPHPWLCVAQYHFPHGAFSSGGSKWGITTTNIPAMFSMVCMKNYNVSPFQVPHPRPPPPPHTHSQAHKFWATFPPPTRVHTHAQSPVLCTMACLVNTIPLLMSRQHHLVGQNAVPIHNFGEFP